MEKSGKCGVLLLLKIEIPEMGIVYISSNSSKVSLLVSSEHFKVRWEQKRRPTALRHFLDAGSV